MSTNITIEDLDDATAKWISKESERRGISVESLVLELIRKGIDIDQETSQLQAYHDLDSLAGTWSEEQETEFLNAVADFEQVDEKMWR
jgi:hypothetical protein